MGKEPPLRKHIADAASVRRQEETSRFVLPHLAGHFELAGGSPLEAGDAAQERGLACTRGSENTRHTGRRQVEVDVEDEAAPPQAEAPLHGFSLVAAGSVT